MQAVVKITTACLFVFGRSPLSVVRPSKDHSIGSLSQWGLHSDSLLIYVDPGSISDVALPPLREDRG